MSPRSNFNFALVMAAVNSHSLPVRTSLVPRPSLRRKRGSGDETRGSGDETMSGHDKSTTVLVQLRQAELASYTTTTTTVLVQLGQAESANYSYSELSYVSAKLYRCSVE